MRDLVEIEIGVVLVRQPRDRVGRADAGGDRDGGLLPAGRGAPREGRLVHEHAAAAAVAPQGGRAEGGLPLRALVLLPPRPAIKREARRIGRTARQAAARRCTWDYPTHSAIQEPERRGGARGDQRLGRATGKPLAAYKELKDDGSTLVRLLDLLRRASPTASTRRRGGSRTGSRSYVAPEWAWAWPANRRILYNRASADPDGKPWSERKRYVWWDESEGKWTGLDVPDFDEDEAARLRAARRTPRPRTRSRGDHPFIMQADGRGWLYVPQGLEDGPLPTHYEPHESPFGNPLYAQRANPRRQQHEDLAEDPYNPARRAGADVYPYVVTTYRLTEHHTAGGMSRSVPYLAELQPEMFCEVHPELARERGLEHGGWATVDHLALGDRGARARHRPDAAAADATAAPCTRSGCRTTGAARARRRATRRTTSRTWRSTRTCTSRRSRRSRATSGPGAPAARRGAPRVRRRRCRRARAREHADGLRLRREAQRARRLLHRHVGLHRLQGLRGRVQGVEPRSRGRARLDGQSLRQHAAARREHVAPRRVRRAARRALLDDDRRPSRCAG